MDNIDILIESLCMKLKIAESKLEKMYPVFEPSQNIFYDRNRNEDEWEELNRSIWVRLKYILIAILSLFHCFASQEQDPGMIQKHC